MALGRAAAALRAAGAALRPTRTPLWARDHPRLCSSQEASKAPEEPKAPKEPPSRYLERPWEYLESEEYRVTYGDRPVWFGYRRNHKGAIPPQRTRKACLRRGKPVGNPCPICRDRNLLVDFRNVKLLDQFICPHSGVVFHPTHTGVCMRQHKLLSKAIAQAQDHGLLWLQVPYVPAPREDFSNRHPAVGKTPPAPALRGPGGFWYSWYERWTPPPAEIARMRRLYRGFLKGEEALPAVLGTPPEAPQSPAGEKRAE